MELLTSSSLERLGNMIEVRQLRKNPSEQAIREVCMCVHTRILQHISTRHPAYARPMFVCSQGTRSKPLWPTSMDACLQLRYLQRPLRGSASRDTSNMVCDNDCSQQMHGFMGVFMLFIRTGRVDFVTHRQSLHAPRFFNSLVSLLGRLLVPLRPPLCFSRLYVVTNAKPASVRRDA
jgi:hypothetical protein